MSIKIIEQRLKSLEYQALGDEENAIKEIAQEIALMALSRANFFRVGAFQDGTCLRILYGLERFSEDLDFVLDGPEANFSWEPYIKNIVQEFELYGYKLEIVDRSQVNTSVKKVFLKTNSIGNILMFDHGAPGRGLKKIRIKLEVDTNPPSGSITEMQYLDFPVPFNVKCQDLPSLFAGKCHALLCREYVKGRDWYDFIWYVSRRVMINNTLLENALIQTGPWQGQDVKVTKKWLLEKLKEKMQKINWPVAKNDVARFLKPQDLPALELWTEDFFLSRLEKLRAYLV